MCVYRCGKLTRLFGIVIVGNKLSLFEFNVIVNCTPKMN